MNIDKIIEATNKHFAKYGRDEKFIKMENLILARKNPYEIYLFARKVDGADFEKCQYALFDINNFKYIYMLGLLKKNPYYYIKNDDFFRFELKVYKPIKPEYQVQLECLCKNNRPVYYDNGLFVVRDNSNYGATFYIDDGTFDMLQKAIDAKLEIPHWHLHYAIVGNNYELVKKILDYGRICRYKDDNYDTVLSEEYCTQNGDHIAMTFPCSTLAYEATGVKDVRILKALVEKGCSPCFRLGVNPIYNAIRYGDIDNVKYMVEELNIPICEGIQHYANAHFFDACSDVQLAYLLRKKEIFEYLMSYGIDINKVLEWDIADLKRLNCLCDVKEFVEKFHISYDDRYDKHIHCSLRQLIEAYEDTEYLEIINNEKYKQALAKRLEREAQEQKEREECQAYINSLENKSKNLVFKRFTNKELEDYIDFIMPIDDEVKIKAVCDHLKQYPKSKTKNLLLKLVYKVQIRHILDEIYKITYPEPYSIDTSCFETEYPKINFEEIHNLIKETETDLVIKIFESILIKKETKYLEMSYDDFCEEDLKPQEEDLEPQEEDPDLYDIPF